MNPRIARRLYRGAGRFVAVASLIACTIPGHTAAPIASLLTAIDAAGLKHEIASHAGRVVVVNFWATWCDPCKAEFPDLARLATTDKSKGLDLVTVSFDDPANVPKSVVPFLLRSRISGTTFVNKSGSHLDDAYLSYLEPKLPPDDAVGLPRTYIFDRKGKLAKVLIGGQTYAAFEAAVKPFLDRS